MYKKTSTMKGLISGVLSSCLWIIFSFFNPYSNANDLKPVLTTFFFKMMSKQLRMWKFVVVV